MNEFSYLEIVFKNAESIIVPESRVSIFNVTHRPASPKSTFHLIDSVYLSILYYEEKELVFNPQNPCETLSRYYKIPNNEVDKRPEVLGRLMKSRDVTIIQTMDKEMNVLNSYGIRWEDMNNQENEEMNINVTNEAINISIHEKTARLVSYEINAESGVNQMEESNEVKKNNKTKTLEVRITLEMDRELKAIAKAQKRTESDIVRGLLENFIRKYEQVDSE